MKPEIEAKFLDIDRDALRAQLRSIGAECVVADRLMKRRNYDFPDLRLDKEHNGWARVRDEGAKVTMSYKQLNNYELDGTQEVILTVDDFDAACSFLESIGLTLRTVQETRRESWELGDLKIDLDEWPWAKPFVEIEGPDGQSLKKIAAELGFDWGQARFGDVWSVFSAEYEIKYGDLNDIPAITFHEPVPDWLEGRRRK